MTFKVTVLDIKTRKNSGPPISMLTAYDYPWAKIVDKAGIDMILVGDSLAMVVLGQKDTVSVTMDQMIHHVRAVSNAVEHSLVIGDMPFGSYNVSIENAVENANLMMKEGGAEAVKIEGGKSAAPIVQALVRAGVPVQGHIGLTPQTVSALGGFKVQGKDAAAAKALMEDAKSLEQAGCFSIVLEAIPAPIAKAITDSISIPTIGIGAGVHCDGQVLVTYDMVGLFDRFTPKFVKKYTDIGSVIFNAIVQYKSDVESKRFPEEAHSFTIRTEELKEIGLVK